MQAFEITKGSDEKFALCSLLYLAAFYILQPYILIKAHIKITL